MNWRTVDEEGKTSLCCVLLMSDALVADPLKSAFFLGPVDHRPQLEAYNGPRGNPHKLLTERHLGTLRPSPECLEA